MKIDPLLRRAALAAPLSLLGMGVAAFAQSAGPQVAPAPRPQKTSSVIDPSIHLRLGVNVGDGGVIVQLQPGSPAVQAGLQLGDRILVFNSHKVTTGKAFVQLVHTATTKRVAMTVLRHGKTLHLMATLGGVASVQAVPVAQAAAPTVGARQGYIVGRVVKEDGSPVPQFKVHYSGFETGKFFLQDSQVGALPNVSGVVTGSNGYFAAKVPDGIYDTNAWVEVNYHGKAYKLPLWPEPQKFDFPNRHLQYLKSGLVHNYVWKISGLRNGFESSSDSAVSWYGGVISADCDTVLRGMGLNSLVFSEPAGSKVELMLVPQGPLIDGSPGKTLVRTFDLKLSGTVKDVPMGAYTATARVIGPGGASKALKISLTPASYNAATSTSTIAWQDAVPILFGPSTNEYSFTDPMGADRVDIYLGEPDALGISKG